MNHEQLQTLYRTESDQKCRVNASIRALQHYMNTYEYSTCGCNGNIFVDDVLYMLGVGYRVFKKVTED